MDAFQQAAAVAFVVGLAVLAAVVSRKGAGGRLAGLRWRTQGNGRLELVQRLMLTPQHSICIVRVDGREITIGVHPGGMTLMTPQSGSDSK